MVVVVGSFFIGTERNTSAITSADGFGVTIDFLEGNGFGKICCGITRGIHQMRNSVSLHYSNIIPSGNCIWEKTSHVS